MGIIPTPLPITKTLSQTTRLCTRSHTRHRTQLPSNNMVLTSRPTITRGSLLGTQLTHNNIPQLPRHHKRGLPGDWTSPSDKSYHLRALPFALFEGPQPPTFIPANHPSQAICINHFLIYEPHHITLQRKESHIISHVFLDHIGVKATIHIPVLHPPQHSIANTTSELDQPHSIQFRFPISQPLLAQCRRKYEK